MLRFGFVDGAKTGNESPSTHSASYIDDGIQWDIYGSAGSGVRPAFYSSDGAVSLSVSDGGDVRSGAVGNGAGRIANVAVRVDGVQVGVVRFMHLVSVAVGPGSPDSSLGPLPPSTRYDGCYGWPCSASWAVPSPAGIHTHLDIDHGCYRNVGVNTALAVGEPIAMLSSAFPKENQSACDLAEMQAVNTVAGGKLVIAGLNTSLPAGSNNVFVRKQLDTNGNWQSSWTSLSGSFTDLDVASSAGKASIVAIKSGAAPGTNNVYVRAELDTNGNWQGGWTALSGYMTKVATAVDSSGKLVIAGLNTSLPAGSNNVFVRKQLDTNGNWQSSWTSLSGSFTDLDVASSAGKASIVAIKSGAAPGTNNVYVRAELDTNGNWQGGWTALSGYMTKVATAVDSSGKLVIAGLNTSLPAGSNNVFVRKQLDTNGNWQSSWTSLSGSFTDLDVASSAGKASIVAIKSGAAPGTNNVYVRAELDTNGNWQGGWTALSGYMTKVATAN